MVEANGTREAKLAGPLGEAGGCDMIACTVLRPGQLDGRRRDLELGAQVARAELSDQLAGGYDCAGTNDTMIDTGNNTAWDDAQFIGFVADAHGVPSI